METQIQENNVAERSNGNMVDVQSSRAMQEVKAAMTIAKRFPRDEYAAIERIKSACKRVGLAESAKYSYPRGGTRVEGASIRLAEMLAQNWGNIDFGVIELEQDKKNAESICMAYAWDLETNTRQSKTFTVPHMRYTKEGTKLLEDPRDIYEMVANNGARRLRACILGVIPGDIQDIAMEECTNTLAGQNKEPLEDRIRKMISAFKDYGVTKAMIEGRLGHDVSAIDETEFVGLRSVYNSLKDGMGSREDFFTVSEKKEAEPKKKSAADVVKGNISNTA